MVSFLGGNVLLAEDFEGLLPVGWRELLILIQLIDCTILKLPFHQAINRVDLVFLQQWRD